MKQGKWIVLGLFLAVIAAVLTFIPDDRSAPEAPRVVSETATVTKVVDGDTVEANGEVVRLLGVDAPEMGSCFYSESKAELARLALGQSVRLESDPQNDDRDEYGRLLRYVYLADGTLVNAELIESGFARHLSWFPIEQNRDFERLESTARENALGLWREC